MILVLRETHAVVGTNHCAYVLQNLPDGCDNTKNIQIVHQKACQIASAILTLPSKDASVSKSSQLVFLQTEILVLLLYSSINSCSFYYIPMHTTHQVVDLQDSSIIISLTTCSLNDTANFFKANKKECVANAL